jgi:hypothetical protein
MNGGLRKLPKNAKQFRNVRALYRHLQEFHGISEVTASERLHAIKQQCGYGAADPLIFDHMGNIYDLQPSAGSAA